MKKTSLKVAIIAILAFATSCGTSDDGQLIGDRSRLGYRAPKPNNMAYVSSGYYKMGASDEDIRGRNDATIHTVQVNGFWMDRYEIRNMEYREFTNWVRDSIARKAYLGYVKDLPDGSQIIDWKKRINWKDAEVLEQLAPMLVQGDQSGWGVRQVNAKALTYSYKLFDFQQASMHSRDADYNEQKYVQEIHPVIYPDTTVWMRQYAYSFNEPIAQQYFWFEGFNDYPVVGVNWYQCQAFCDWRTYKWKNKRDQRKQYFESRFRLPTEQEWEWAARGLLNESPYPWGGPYILNKKGCYLANFKPQRGNYSADGGMYTVKVGMYAPNGFTLYDMAGNVSEWTSSAYSGGSYNSMTDFNGYVPYNSQNSDPLYQRRKVVRGGSWRDVAYYLQVGTRDYEYADTAKPYIGFRCVYTEIEPALRNNRAWKRK